MNNQGRGVLRIGTSGVVVPGSKETFPDAFRHSSRLSYYASLFNTVEVNSTFKKIPMLSTFEKWSDDVAEDFQFTIKIWKEITHVKQLKIDLDNVNTFMNAASHIGNKKGCLLVQFPGSITAEYSGHLEQILERIDEVDGEGEWRRAIELRNVTWYKDEIYHLIKRYNSTLVLHDMPKSKNLLPNDAARFVYFRFHGPTGDYRGNYSDYFLEEQAQKIGGLLSDGKDVYVYFNNTMGNAFENAMSLKAMVERLGVRG